MFFHRSCSVIQLTLKYSDGVVKLYMTEPNVPLSASLAVMVPTLTSLPAKVEIVKLYLDWANAGVKLLASSENKHVHVVCTLNPGELFPSISFLSGTFILNISKIIPGIKFASFEKL